MEIGGISNIGPARKIGATTPISNKITTHKTENSDTLEVSDFLKIRKAMESITPINEIKFKELKQILAEKGKLEITDEQLEKAIRNFIDEIFS